MQKKVHNMKYNSSHCFVWIQKQCKKFELLSVTYSSTITLNCCVDATFELLNHRNITAIFWRVIWLVCLIVSQMCSVNMSDTANVF
jgi:hypothetical protein